MQRNIFSVATVVCALVGAVTVAGQAQASCGSSQRIDYKDADCLDADWNNNYDGWSGGKVWARNECSEYGTVVAKIDIRDTSDRTWYLEDDKKREEGTLLFNTRDVYCCEDLSHLCDKSDIDDDSCMERFHESSADDTCINESASLNSDHECTINAECEHYHPDTWYRPTEITVHWSKVDELHNCEGHLKDGSC